MVVSAAQTPTVDDSDMALARTKVSLSNTAAPALRRTPTAETLVQQPPSSAPSPSAERRYLQPPRARGERKIYGRRQPHVGIGGEHRTVPQCGGKRGTQVLA